MKTWFTKSNLGCRCEDQRLFWGFPLGLTEEGEERGYHFYHSASQMQRHADAPNYYSCFWGSRSSFGHCSYKKSILCRWPALRLVPVGERYITWWRRGSRGPGEKAQDGGGRGKIQGQTVRLDGGSWEILFDAAGLLFWLFHESKLIFIYVHVSPLLT